MSALSFTVATRAAAQATGSVIGRVTDAASGVPIAQARVTVSGTLTNALTSDSGRYTLRATTTGTITLEFSRIGYEAERITVTVTGTTPVVADMQLKAAAFSLGAVVTTVTGQQRKVELANAVAQINVADKIAELPVSNMGALLSGRTSSVQVLQPGGTGAGSRIRIRGQNSFSLANDPIVIIDGVRATSSMNNMLGTGSAGPSRLDDINPQEIERIEIVKGPSAATLYGTEAANGVIVVTTKRGKSGKTIWNFSAENGRIDQTAKYPDLWSLWGRTAASPNKAVPCLLTAVAAGTCTAIDSLSHGNVMNDPNLTPVGVGSRQQYNLQASGGNDKLQFFLSGQTETETGIYKMPISEVSRLQLRRGVTELPSDILRPNALGRNSFRANLSSEVRPGLFVQASAGYVNSNVRIPQFVGSGEGLMTTGIAGPWRADLVDAQGDSLHGYRAWQMGDALSLTTTQAINRFVNSVSAQWTPATWLSTRAAIGSDYTTRTDQFLAKVGEGPSTGTLRQGNITSLRAETNQQTADYGATGTFQLLDWLKSTTSVGMQYVRGAIGQTVGTGIGLPPGGVTVSSAATRSSTQTDEERRTIGYYVEQQIALNDRLFLTGGARRDAASAFGENTRAVYYPKVGASYLISDEKAFKIPEFVSSLRLRATYGASGQIPGATDAVRFYTAGPLTTATGDAPAASPGSLGNPNLKPEFSAETEFGFDLAMFDGATNIEFTSYNKSTTDALIRRLIAPSLSGLTTQFVNVGNIKNQGLELTWNQRVIDRSLAAVAFTLNASTNKNRMTKLGDGISPIVSGDRQTQRNLPGYPLFGLWGNTINFSDKNGDGIIVFNANPALSELSFSDTAVFQGNTYPTREVSFSPSVELFNKTVRVSALVDGKYGFKKFNNTLRHQCQNAVSCRGRYDPNASLQEQANALSTTQAVYTGMYEDGSFTRFRELSVSYQLPNRWANAIRASRWAVVLTGRNLGVSTKYSGVDPEAVSAANNDASGNEDYLNTPPLRTLLFRMNFTF
ncbi:MAG: SusC/RagA family TonB-linked outer membrane protein [Gemmatimonadaceae bacterium]